MDISVIFDDGLWRTFPDPAIVRRGSSVTWRFLSMRSEDALAWEVYFGRAPFLKEQSLIVTSFRNQNGQHAADVTADAEKPGDYKYGVRVADAKSGEPIGDDDPRLIVT